MNAQNLIVLIQMNAIMVRVESMKAQNQLRKAQGEYPEYHLADFDTYADQLDSLSCEVSHEC